MSQVDFPKIKIENLFVEKQNLNLESDFYAINDAF